MNERPWWRDPRKLPPASPLDRYIGGVNPQGLVFAGTWVVFFGVLATFYPDSVPVGSTLFGGVLIGSGVLLRRKADRSEVD